jgi:hypothetical protein
MKENQATLASLASEARLNKPYPDAGVSLALLTFQNEAFRGVDFHLDDSVLW